jgi:hypothetical protein
MAVERRMRKNGKIMEVKVDKADFHSIESSPSQLMPASPIE